MTAISPLSFYQHYYVPPVDRTVYQEVPVGRNELPDAVKPVKEIIDEHRTQMRSSEGEWRRGSKMDIYV
tara:strand:- start:1170 stop:1376 length:207 start_codon:yes stop_codon:yes gene_type:complete